MKDGFILISVRDGSSKEEPYRTGKWCVIKEEAMRRLVAYMNQPVPKSRMIFVEDRLWLALRLPGCDATDKA
jgi:hypothetical protein